MAESDSEASSYGGTASNFVQNELDDEEGDFFQPGMLAYRGEPQMTRKRTKKSRTQMAWLPQFLRLDSKRESKLMNG